jgi:uncharacterized protein (TIGR00369 family)
MTSAGDLAEILGGIPYLRFLGIRFRDEAGDLTAVLPFQPMLIGNPVLPALHGGVTAAFLEVTAVAGLLAQREAGDLDLPLPKTIDLTVDYLRPGQPKDAFARARINRQGRRYASVQVEAWQDDPTRPFAAATGHFLMPDPGPV